jgi:hypothetical protein
MAKIRCRGYSISRRIVFFNLIPAFTWNIELRNAKFLFSKLRVHNVVVFYYFINKLDIKIRFSMLPSSWIILYAAGFSLFFLFDRFIAPRIVLNRTTKCYSAVCRYRNGIC